MSDTVAARPTETMTAFDTVSPPSPTTLKPGRSMSFTSGTGTSRGVGFDIPPLSGEESTSLRAMSLHSIPSLPSLHSVNLETPKYSHTADDQAARGDLPFGSRATGPRRGSEARTPPSPSQLQPPPPPRHHPYLNHRLNTMLGPVMQSTFSPSSHIETSSIARHLLPQELANEGWESEPFKRRTSNNVMMGGGAAAPELMTSSGPMISMMPYKRLSSKVNTPLACAACKRAHLGCDTERPCRRCQTMSKPELCVDVIPKKRGRPKVPKPSSEIINADPNNILQSSRQPPSHSDHTYHELGWSPKQVAQRSFPSRSPYYRSSSAEVPNQNVGPPSPPSDLHGGLLHHLGPSPPSLMERRLRHGEKLQMGPLGIRRLSDFGPSLSKSASQAPLERPWVETQVSASSSSGGSPSSLSTIFATTSLDILRCSHSTEEATGFSLAQLNSQPLLRFVHSDDIKAVKQLRLQLLGKYSERALQANAEINGVLRRQSEGDLQVPAPNTPYVDENIRILASNGEYRMFNARMHIGGCFGADADRDSTICNAYIVISLLKLEKGRDSSTSANSSRRESSAIGPPISSPAPRFGYKLPPFSAISAGLADGDYSQWHTMPPTPLLVRPPSGSSTASSPGTAPPSSFFNQGNWLGPIPGGSARSPAIAVVPSIDIFADSQLTSNRQLPVPTKRNSFPWARMHQEHHLENPGESYSLLGSTDANAQHLDTNYNSQNLPNGNAPANFSSRADHHELPRLHNVGDNVQDRHVSRRPSTATLSRSVLEGWNPVDGV